MGLELLRSNYRVDELSFAIPKGTFCEQAKAIVDRNCESMGY